MNETDDWLRKALADQAPDAPRGRAWASIARTSSRRRRRVRAGAAAASLVVVASLISGVFVVAHRSAAPAPAASCVRPTVSSPCVQNAVRDTVAGIEGLGLLTDVHLGAPPKEYDASGLWLYARATPAGLRDPRRVAWLATVTAGAVAARIADGRRALDGVISGARVTNVADGDESLGSASPVGQDFEAQQRGYTDEQIRDHIAAVLSSFDLQAARIEISRPLGPVPSVTAEVADPRTLAGKANQLQSALFGQTYEGFFLDVTDRLGNSLATIQSFQRAGGGGVSFAPTIAELWGIAYSSPPPVRPGPPSLPDLATALTRTLPGARTRPYSGASPPLLSGPGASSHLKGNVQKPLGLLDLATTGGDGTVTWHPVWVVTAESDIDPDPRRARWIVRVAAYDATNGELVARGSYRIPGPTS